MSLLIYFVYWLLISLLIESGRCFSFPDFFFFTIFHIFKTLNNYFAFEYVSWLCSMIYAIVIWRVKESVDKRSYFFRNFLELHWSDVVSLIRRCCQLICLFFGGFFSFDFLMKNFIDLFRSLGMRRHQLFRLMFSPLFGFIIVLQ